MSMEAAHAILRQLPPSELEKSKTALFNHAFKDDPISQETLNTKLPLPFRIINALATVNDKPFLATTYNHVGEDKFRSPWTGSLYRSIDDCNSNSDSLVVEDGQHRKGDVRGDEELRLLEEKMNSVWEPYKSLYYGHESVGSVYLSDRNGSVGTKGAFHGMFGIRKDCSGGSWNSIHLVHVDEPTESTCNYRVESTVLIVVEPVNDPSSAATADLSAYLSKQTIKNCKISPISLASSHIENIGTLIESNEIDIRASMERVYIPKIRNLMDNIQKNEPKRRVEVNPLIGMIMNSDMLRKKLANEMDSAT